MTTKILYGPGGWHVEWYEEHEAGDRVAHWYGTREACERRAKHAPAKSWWVEVDHHDGPPPYDAATGTGMYD